MVSWSQVATQATHICMGLFPAQPSDTNMAPDGEPTYIWTTNSGLKVFIRIYLNFYKILWIGLLKIFNIFSPVGR